MEENLIDKSVIFAAPSGAGKSTIVKNIMKSFYSYLDVQFGFSVSHTTRPKGDSEIDGVDYHFISAEKFNEMIVNGEFLEWEEVYPGGFYGTSKAEVARIKSLGSIAVFDIDVEGARKIKTKLGDAVKYIFVEAPSLFELEKRIRERGRDKEERIIQRIAKAPHEMEQKIFADVVVTNDDLQEALFDTIHIIAKFLGIDMNSAAFGQMIYDLFKEKHNNTLVLITGMTNCGKTTQGKLLKEKFFPNARVADSGDLVREYLGSNDMDPQDKISYESGGIISPDRVVLLWRDRLKKAFESGRMIILSGSPRSPREAYAIIRDCKEMRYNVVCLVIDISDDEAVTRLKKRNETSGRTDTLTPEAIQKKLQQTVKVINAVEAFRGIRRVKTHYISGIGSIPEITERLAHAIKEKKIAQVG